MPSCITSFLWFLLDYCWHYPNMFRTKSNDEGKNLCCSTCLQLARSETHMDRAVKCCFSLCLQMLLDPMGGIVMTNDGNAILREVSFSWRIVLLNVKSVCVWILGDNGAVWSHLSWEPASANQLHQERFLLRRNETYPASVLALEKCRFDPRVGSFHGVSTRVIQILW